ncbi:MAG: cupin domain-containing protein [Gammaproteobacteria bacterium]|nr:cupin domain-containing protein [Gammaproteobacteria bacterium]
MNFSRLGNMGYITLLVILTGATSTGANMAFGEESSGSDDLGYEPEGTGTRELGSGDLVIKILVESLNLGSSDVEVGEIYFPPGYESSRHSHGTIEIFYVLSGTLIHEVNGMPHELKPGMVGIVRPPDTVVHRAAGGSAVKALVIWAPGGEVDRLAEVFPRQRSLR